MSGELPSRPLEPEERDQLVRLVRSPGAMVTRAIGLLAGLAATALSVTYFLGVSYDPTNFFYLVLGLSFLALFAGAAALGIVRPPRAALRHDRAVELNGAPSTDSVRAFGQTSVRMGPVRLVIPKSRSAAVRIGETQSLVVALGVSAMRAPGYGMVPRGVLLRVNGAALPRPPIVFIS